MNDKASLLELFGDQRLQYFGYFLGYARYIYYQPSFLCVDLRFEINDKMKEIWDNDTYNVFKRES